MQGVAMDLYISQTVHPWEARLLAFIKMRQERMPNRMSRTLELFIKTFYTGSSRLELSTLRIGHFIWIPILGEFKAYLPGVGVTVIMKAVPPG